MRWRTAGGAPTSRELIGDEPRVLMSHPATEHLETVSFALLPDLTDCRVHAVYDPADEVPLSVCGFRVLPDVTVACEVIFCRRCLAVARADDVELRPACGRRPQFRRWRWRGRWFDWRIQRALHARRKVLDARRRRRG